MKALIKYSFPLFVVLLGVCSQLPVSANKEAVSHLIPENISSVEYANVCIHYHLILKSSPSGEKKESFQLDAAENEVEEYELVSSRKNVDSNNHVIAIICSQALNCFSGASNKTLLFSRYLSYISSYRYLAFQSFRI